MDQIKRLAERWLANARRISVAVMTVALVVGCASSNGNDAGTAGAAMGAGNTNAADMGPGSGGDASLNDPLEGLNRHVFAFNDAVDTMVVKPAAYIYREATPRPIKGIITNFLGHLTLPLTIIHDLLQGKPEQAQVAFGRLFINTVAGIGGLFDIATPFGFPMHEEDMGQTLAVHGGGPGPYLVLPLLGPSSARDAFGTLIDAFADPMTIASYGVTSGFTLRISRAAADGVVQREQLIEPLNALKDSLDYYASVRAAYRQRRAAEIRDGAPLPAGDETDPFATFEAGGDKTQPATER